MSQEKTPSPAPQDPQPRSGLREKLFGDRRKTVRTLGTGILLAAGLTLLANQGDSPKTFAEAHDGKVATLTPEQSHDALGDVITTIRGLEQAQAGKESGTLTLAPGETFDVSLVPNGDNTKVVAHHEYTTDPDGPGPLPAAGSVDVIYDLNEQPAPGSVFNTLKRVDQLHMAPSHVGFTTETTQGQPISAAYDIQVVDGNRLMVGGDSGWAPDADDTQRRFDFISTLATAAQDLDALSDRVAGD